MRNILVVFLLLCQAVQAQNKLNIDSLLSAYDQQTGKTKLKTNNHIINYYMYRNIVAVEKYVRAQLQLANELEFDSAKTLANYQMAVYHSNLNNTDSSTYYNMVEESVLFKLL